MTANHHFSRLHHLKQGKKEHKGNGTAARVVLLIFVCTFGVAAEEDAPYVVYGNGATSERNLPLCSGPRDACNVVRRRFWLSPIVHRMCKCPDRTSCPTDFNDLSDKKTIAFNARAQLKFCSRVGELEHCGYSTVAASIDLNGAIQIHCFCAPSNFYQRLYRNSTAQYFRCTQLGTCREGDFCGHIAAKSYETYHICTCPAGHICILRDRMKVHSDEFLQRGPAYRGICTPRYL